MTEDADRPSVGTRNQELSFEERLQQRVDQFWRTHEELTQAWANRPPSYYGLPLNLPRVRPQQNATSGTEITDRSLAHSRVRRIMMEQSCDDPLVCPLPPMRSCSSTGHNRTPAFEASTTAPPDDRTRCTRSCSIRCRMPP